MKLYDQTIDGVFLDRPNRFIARVRIGEEIELCHVKNTGRCAELLVPGARVTLFVSGRQNRKTKYDLVAVQKGALYINMDSQAPNRAAGEAMPRLFPRATLIRPEVVYGESRLDFYIEETANRTWLEVKGVTLEENGVALFPDAPTERGRRHLGELEKCLRAGDRAVLLLVIQMKGVSCFRPNRRQDPAFANALVRARRAGVEIWAYDCLVTPDSMTLDQPVPIELE